METSFKFRVYFPQLKRNESIVIKKDVVTINDIKSHINKNFSIPIEQIILKCNDTIAENDQIVDETQRNLRWQCIFDENYHISKVPNLSFHDEIDNDAIEYLCNMQFSRTNVIEALKNTKGDIDEALKLLKTKITKDDRNNFDSDDDTTDGPKLLDEYSSDETDNGPVQFKSDLKMITNQALKNFIQQTKDNPDKITFQSNIAALFRDAEDVFARSAKELNSMNLPNQSIVISMSKFPNQKLYNLINQKKSFEELISILDERKQSNESLIKDLQEKKGNELIKKFDESSKLTIPQKYLRSKNTYMYIAIVPKFVFKFLSQNRHIFNISYIRNILSYIYNHSPHIELRSVKRVLKLISDRQNYLLINRQKASLAELTNKIKKGRSIKNILLKIDTNLEDIADTEDEELSDDLPKSTEDVESSDTPKDTDNNINIELPRKEDNIINVEPLKMADNIINAEQTREVENSINIEPPKMTENVINVEQPKEADNSISATEVNKERKEIQTSDTKESTENLEQLVDCLRRRILSDKLAHELLRDADNDVNLASFLFVKKLLK